MAMGRQTERQGDLLATWSEKPAAPVVPYCSAVDTGRVIGLDTVQPSVVWRRGSPIDLRGQNGEVRPGGQRGHE